MSAGEFIAIALGPGEAVILDMLGAEAIETQPAGETAILLELGGRLNKSADRWRGKFLMSAPQSAELIATIVVAARRGGSTEWIAEFDAALEREQQRLAAVDGEWSA